MFKWLYPGENVRRKRPRRIADSGSLRTPIPYVSGVAMFGIKKLLPDLCDQQSVQYDMECLLSQG